MGEDDRLDEEVFWTKFGDERIFRIDERHYERYGRWDCIFAIPRPEGWQMNVSMENMGFGR